MHGKIHLMMYHKTLINVLWGFEWLARLLFFASFRLKRKITAISLSNTLMTAFTISKCHRRTTPKTPEKWDSFLLPLFNLEQRALCEFVWMCFIFQRWLEAIEEHSAFSTHYCSQDPDSEEEEDNVVSVNELSDSLQVRNVLCILYIPNNHISW